jgi:hypothetical protein
MRSPNNMQPPDSNVNYDGYQLQYSPDWTVNGTYFDDFPLPQGRLRAGATAFLEPPRTYGLRITYGFSARAAVNRLRRPAS